ncbi:Segregation and condensation protein A [bacterium HR15]|nr:Segregation and condensation protein A [bacterium HR15]
MRRFYIGQPEWSPPRVPLQLPLGSGTLGWLITLIRRQKLDVLEVALAPIAQACYDYWRTVGDLDEAADALAVLAYLMERKAERLLMPEPPVSELVEEAEPVALCLPERYIPLIEYLREREAARSQLFFRGMSPDPAAYESPLPWGAMLPDQLWLALRRLLQRAAPIPDAIPERRYFSIHAHMVEIQEQVRRANTPLPFETLARPARSVLELLVYFLALLELWRLGQVEVQVQNGEIMVVSGGQPAGA